MVCKNCPYFWKEDDDCFRRCHFKEKAPGDLPPCEEDDNETEDADTWYEDDCYENW